MFLVMQRRNIIADDSPSIRIKDFKCKNQIDTAYQSLTLHHMYVHGDILHGKYHEQSLCICCNLCCIYPCLPHYLQRIVLDSDISSTAKTVLAALVQSTAHNHFKSLNGIAIGFLSYLDHFQNNGTKTKDNYMDNDDVKCYMVHQNSWDR